MKKSDDTLKIETVEDLEKLYVAFHILRIGFCVMRRFLNSSQQSQYCSDK